MSDFKYIINAPQTYENYDIFIDILIPDAKQTVDDTIYSTVCGAWLNNDKMFHVINANSQLLTMGNNPDGQLGTYMASNNSPIQTVAGGANWKEISCEYQHTAAIKTDGTLWTWGNGSNGKLGTGNVTHRSSPVQIGAGTDWKQVSCGIIHTAAVKTNGTLWTWGSGTNGRLGTDDIIHRSSPVQVAGTTWKQVSCAASNTAAIKTDGTLWLWGSGSSGQLGQSDLIHRSSPVQVAGTTWKQVSCGDIITSAVKTDGTLWTWGNNNSGQLGDNTTVDKSSPVQVAGTTWKQVSCGSGSSLRFTAAIQTDGSLWTWGSGAAGQLGTSYRNNLSSPVQVITGGVNYVTATFDNTIVVRTDGRISAAGGNIVDAQKYIPGTTIVEFDDVFVKRDVFSVGNLWGWGSNSDGQLGDNTTVDKSSPIQTTAGGTNWKQVAGAGSHIAAIKTDSTLWTWGWNALGQLGTNNQLNRSSPVQTVSGGTNWKQVACGAVHTSAIKTDGTLWTWGSNSSGRLGTNNQLNRSSPVQTIAGGNNWKHVACGSSHTVAIKTDGTLWGWGHNTSGRLGDDTTVSKSSPVQTVSGGTTWKQVACGSSHTVAIKTDGTLWTWGTNTNGQLGDNTTVDKSSPVQTVSGGTTWKQVAGGAAHTAAIKTDGTLWLWGLNTNGRLGTNNELNSSSPVQTIAGGNNWKHVACGDEHTIALKTDGTLWTWGSGTNGRLGTDDIIHRSSPVQVAGTTWKQVAAISTSTFAIVENDDIEL